VAVEPNPVALVTLEKNLRYLKDRVTIVRKAVADRAQRMTLYDQGQLAMASLRPQLEPNGLGVEGLSAVEVNAVTLEAILAECHFPRVDLLKMDIEGAEMDVFKAINPQTLDSVNAVIVECHPWRGVDPQVIVDKLAAAGMDVAHTNLLVTGTRTNRKMRS
jgi:FkbM family methyltransferase